MTSEQLQKAIEDYTKEKGPEWEQKGKELQDQLATQGAALQAQLTERQADQWTLRVETETLRQPGARDRLQNALADAGHGVRLNVELGRVADSPARRNSYAAAQRMKAAEALVMADPFVQEMMREFGAKIVPGSIKPL